MMDVRGPRYLEDAAATLANRARLEKNANLLFWYEQLYAGIFSGMPPLGSLNVLEVGSGTSPLKRFHPSVVTSDVLDLDYLDHVFDCHQIDRYEKIPDQSLDVITFTNVLHHLRDPMVFLKAARSKLKPGGKIIAVEPYFSMLSTPIYRRLHHELVDFNIERPLLGSVEGPLSSSNQAIPHMLFFQRTDWMDELSGLYDTQHIRFNFFSSLSYMATGGISRTIPMPASLYRLLLKIDNAAAKMAPSIFASFFVAELVAL